MAVCYTIAGFMTGSMDSPVTYAGGLLTVIFATAWAIGFGRVLWRVSLARHAQVTAR